MQLWTTVLNKGIIFRDLNHFGARFYIYFHLPDTAISRIESLVIYLLAITLIFNGDML